MSAATSKDQLDNAAHLSGANDRAIGQNPTNSLTFTLMGATRADCRPPSNCHQIPCNSGARLRIFSIFKVGEKIDFSSHPVSFAYARHEIQQDIVATCSPSRL
jgi:hypothetical protein